MLMREDFPTLDLPINANSGGPPLGQELTLGYEQTKSALMMSKLVRFNEDETKNIKGKSSHLKSVTRQVAR
jgi:hypothetical protein